MAVYCILHIAASSQPYVVATCTIQVKMHVEELICCILCLKLILCRNIAIINGAMS